MINTSFKFTVKDSDDYILYTCRQSHALPGYYIVSWVYKNITSAVDYTAEQVKEYVEKGFWVIVGEDNA
jgi:hypothetical protein